MRFQFVVLFVIGTLECKVITFQIRMIIAGFLTLTSSTATNRSVLQQLCSTPPALHVPPLCFVLVIRVGLCRMT